MIRFTHIGQSRYASSLHCRAEADAFEVTDKDRIFAVLTARLGQAWNITNINDAPDGIRVAIQGFGGLTANQLLFTSDWKQDLVLLVFFGGLGVMALLSPFALSPMV